MMPNNFAEAFKRLAGELRNAGNPQKVALGEVARGLERTLREHEKNKEHVNKELARGAGLTKHRITL